MTNISAAQQPTTTPDAEGSHEAAHAHGASFRQYIYVFIALCVLTSASFFTNSSYWPWRDSPHLTWSFMIAVSITKALLVVLVFMHVLYEASWKYVLTIPCIAMALFLGLMLVPDIGLRNQSADEYTLEHMAHPPSVQQRLREAAAKSPLPAPKPGAAAAGAIQH
jgi:cytochrome c oxidase subunit 4